MALPVVCGFLQQVRFRDFWSTDNFFFQKLLQCVRRVDFVVDLLVNLESFTHVRWHFDVLRLAGHDSCAVWHSRADTHSKARVEESWVQVCPFMIPSIIFWACVLTLERGLPQIHVEGCGRRGQRIKLCRD